MNFGDPAWLEEEARLLEGLRRGQRSAFEALYRAFAEPLFHRVLLPRLGDRDLAADALAETFRVFFERVGEYQVRDRSVWSWLATVAANQATDIHRDRGRRARILSNYQALLEPLWAEMGPPSPDEAHDQQRLCQAVGSVLEAIHPRYRRAIELRFLEDRPRPECAEALAVQPGTFDVLLLRALRAFRAAWQGRFPQSEACA